MTSVGSAFFAAAFLFELFASLADHGGTLSPIHGWPGGAKFIIRVGPASLIINFMRCQAPTSTKQRAPSVAAYE